MYRFYESEYHKNNKKVDKKLKKNEKKIKKLEKDFKKYKKSNDKIITAYNSLFNSLFLYNEIKPKRLVQLSHDLTLEMLDFIDNICKKHDLQWWMYAGTLLGAIRHEVYIPWDDDIDICMLREDYEKFFKIFPEEVAECGLTKRDITITNTKYNRKKDRYLPFSKVEFWVWPHNYSFIDIFPVDYVTDLVPDYKSLHKKECKDLIEKLKSGTPREEALKESFEKLHVSKDKTDLLMCGVEDTTFAIASDYDTIFPLKTLKFEDRMYPCPNDYITYIIGLYGENYVKIPKNAHPHGFYGYLSSHDNVYENLEICLEKLKKANERYK